MTKAGSRRTKREGARWLRYEISRNITLRNLAIAAIIAISIIALLLIVALAPRLTRRGASRLPAATTAVDQPVYDLAGDKLIPPTPEVRDKIEAFLIDQGVYEGFDLFDVQEARGYTISNVALIEQGEGWSHSCVIAPKHKHYHTYMFRYACGHYADTCVDPYRDLMYADPQAVADRYAKMLCHDCELLQQHLDQKRAEPKAQDATHGK